MSRHGWPSPGQGTGPLSAMRPKCFAPIVKPRSMPDLPEVGSGRARFHRVATPHSESSCRFALRSLANGKRRRVCGFQRNRVAWPNPDRVRSTNSTCSDGSKKSLVEYRLVLVSHGGNSRVVPLDRGRVQRSCGNFLRSPARRELRAFKASGGLFGSLRPHNRED